MGICMHKFIDTHPRHQVHSVQNRFLYCVGKANTFFENDHYCIAIEVLMDLKKKHYVNGNDNDKSYTNTL